MDIYVISDTHFGHDNMVKWALRPEDFNEKLWKGFDSLPDDCILIHCGDVTLGSDAMTHWKLSTYKFKKWLVLGNHDKHGISWYVRNGWDFVGDEVVIKKYGRTTLFTHAPMPKREGVDQNIHGHLHNGLSRGRPDFYDEAYHKEVTPEVIGYRPVKIN